MQTIAGFQIKNGAVDDTKLASNAVSNGKIADNAVTAAKMDSNTKTATIGTFIDGGDEVLTTGIKGYISVPFNCTITEWLLFSNNSGSGGVVVDVLKSSYSEFPPQNSICGGSKPSLTGGATKNSSSTLTSWTTTLTQGDVLALNIDSVTTMTKLTIQLFVTKV
jgi:hypothetical protein